MAQRDMQLSEHYIETRLAGTRVGVHYARFVIHGKWYYLAQKIQNLELDVPIQVTEEMINSFWPFLEANHGRKGGGAKT